MPHKANDINIKLHISSVINMLHHDMKLFSLMLVWPVKFLVSPQCRGRILQFLTH